MISHMHTILTLLVFTKGVKSHPYSRVTSLVIFVRLLKQIRKDSSVTKQIIYYGCGKTNFLNAERLT